jgi:hypothetical protein
MFHSRCVRCGRQFEGWFRDGGLEAQRNAGEILA